MDFPPKLQELQQRIPLSVDDVLAYPLPAYNANVEDALRCSSNPNIFFTAGLAFLQRQLMKRIGRKGSSSEGSGREGGGKLEKRYSDLLIFEVKTEMMSQKFFVRVKNTEKYDEMMRREACLPVKALTLDQILPTPKKMHRKSRSVLSLFNKSPKPSLSAMSIVQSPSQKVSSFSLFSLFRKSRSEGDGKTSELSLKLGSGDVAFGSKTASYGRNAINDPMQGDYSKSMNGRKFSSKLSGTSVTTTLEMNTISYETIPFGFTTTTTTESDGDESALFARGPKKRGHNTIRTIVPVRDPINGVEFRSYRGRILSKAELEILKIIPDGPAVFVRKSTSNGDALSARSKFKNSERGSARNERKGRCKYNRGNRCTSAANSESTIASSKASSECRSSLRHRSSKTSLCTDDQELDDSDLENYASDCCYNRSLRKLSCNLTDEVKSNFSAERLDKIMRRFVEGGSKAPSSSGK